MRLTVVVSDCPAVAPGELEGAPALPLVSTILRYARSRLSGGWWQPLAERFAPWMTDPCPGAMAAAALPAAIGDAWLATPVILQATADHLRLPARGLLRLPGAQCERLTSDFARVFAGSGLQLQATRGRFVLRGLEATADATTQQDPAELLGARLPALSRGSSALRRLSSEIELWLHEHPVNVARTAHGDPLVSTLWLWGGGAVRPGTTARPGPAPRFFGDDPVIDGLAILAGASQASAPQAATWAQLVTLSGDVVLQLSLASSAGGATRSLESIEAEWLQPAVHRLKGGEIESLELLMGPVCATLTSSAFFRVWRRSRPWWEYLRR